MPKLANERLFFEHVALQIEKLANTYAYVFDEIEKQKIPVSASIDDETPDNVEYIVLIKRLNRAITSFKKEMQECLKDYIYLKKLNVMSGDNSARYIQSHLDKLHKENAVVINSIPESHLKRGLGNNFYFHTNMKKFTPEILLEYFETNFSLLIEDQEDWNNKILLIFSKLNLVYFLIYLTLNNKTRK